MGKTEKNLGDAFAGESQANRKYLAFAKQADQEGHKQVAKLFRAAAEAETVHAHAHLRTLSGVGKTVDNLGKNADVDYYVCSVCGMTVEKEAPEKCPVCGAAKKAFFKVA